MKVLATLAVALLLSTQLTAQTQSWSKIAQGTALPSGVWSSGYLYFRTADSTVHVSTGTTWRQVNKTRDVVDLRADDWFGTSANGAAVDTVANIPIKLFDTATAETLTVDFLLPDWFSNVDSLVLEVGANSTAADSAAFAFQWVGRAFNEALTIAYSTALRDTIDLGTAANVMKKMVISGSFTNLAAKDRMKMKLFRDPSIANDEAGDVYVIAARLYGKGLR